MDGKKSFRVVVIADLSDRERQILSTAARLTTTRARSYVFEFNSNVPADIYLVDGDAADKHMLWRMASVQRPAPALWLMADPRGTSGKREIKRPTVPVQILSPLIQKLDEITVQEYRFLPELSIGQEGAPAATTVSIVTPRSQFSALVLDDSPTVQAQVGLGLKMFGVAADFADTAEKALKLLERGLYDIAFLDVILPGGADGYQVCKAIKKNRRMKHTKVIMLTGKSSTFDRVKASLAGCDDFLTKPVQNEVFQQILRKYLRKYDDVLMGQMAHAES